MSTTSANANQLTPSTCWLYSIQSQMCSSWKLLVSPPRGGKTQHLLLHWLISNVIEKCGYLWEKARQIWRARGALRILLEVWYTVYVILNSVSFANACKLFGGFFFFNSCFQDFNSEKRKINECSCFFLICLSAACLFLTG